MVVHAPTWRPRPTLAGTDYTSEATYADEREAIWWGGWICIGRAEEIPEPVRHEGRRDEAKRWRCRERASA